MPRVTIRDIAKKLNINPSTVSRALRDHPDVSRDLKERIKKLAEKSGYKPNSTAISLRSGKSHTIGLIIPEISMFFFPSVIKAVEEEAHKHGYKLLILHSNDSIEREMENSEICANTGVDGILVSLSRQSRDIEHFQELTYAGVPIVYFDKVLPGSHGHKVIIPGESATIIVMKELLKICKKNERICGIFGDRRLSITEDRLSGFHKILASAKIKSPEKNILFAHDSEDAEEKFTQMWNEKIKPSALFVMSDEILAGVLRAMNRLGINAPGDLNIVAMSDGFLPKLMRHPIPYVETSGFELGKTASVLLFNLINGMPIMPDTHFIDTPFVK